MLGRKEQQLFDALVPRATDEHIEVVTVEVVGAKKAPTIRVYIDTEQGVGFDELSTAQVWINEVMDELDPFPGAYTLEVSSPGIDRPLRTAEHFRRFVGETAVVKMNGPIDGRGTWTGTILRADGDVVVLDVDGDALELPFEGIRSAHLKGSIDFSTQ